MTLYTQTARQRNKGRFDRSCLPRGEKEVEAYYKAQGISLSPRGEWRDSVCPFHGDTKPSLRVKAETGAFRCMACGARGGDVLDFHMMLHRMSFTDAAKALNAWEGGHDK